VCIVVHQGPCPAWHNVSTTMHALPRSRQGLQQLSWLCQLVSQHSNRPARTASSAQVHSNVAYHHASWQPPQRPCTLEIMHACLHHLLKAVQSTKHPASSAMHWLSTLHLTRSACQAQAHAGSTRLRLSLSAPALRFGVSLQGQHRCKPAQAHDRPVSSSRCCWVILRLAQHGRCACGSGGGVHGCICLWVSPGRGQRTPGGDCQGARVCGQPGPVWTGRQGQTPGLKREQPLLSCSRLGWSAAWGQCTEPLASTMSALISRLIPSLPRGLCIDPKQQKQEQHSGTCIGQYSTGTGFSIVCRCCKGSNT